MIREVLACKELLSLSNERVEWKNCILPHHIEAHKATELAEKLSRYL